MNILISVIEQGLIYSIVILGIYISYKILNFPDMGAEGSFTLGAVLTAILISNGINPIICIFISIIAGAIVGLITGLINVKLKVKDLLAGIIVMMAFYSINLKIAGKSNISIYNLSTIFNNSFFKSSTNYWICFGIIIIIVLICKLLLDWYLKTKSGYLLKAVGENEKLVISLGKNSGHIKIIGMMIANALVGLGGCILVQQQGYYDISMGSGIMILAITSVIIGLLIFKNNKFVNNTSAVIIGSILYKFLLTVALKYGFEASDLKLITAVLFLVILIIGEKRLKKEDSDDRN